MRRKLQRWGGTSRKSGVMETRYERRGREWPTGVSERGQLIQRGGRDVSRLGEKGERV